MFVNFVVQLLVLYHFTDGVLYLGGIGGSTKVIVWIKFEIKVLATEVFGSKLH